MRWASRALHILQPHTQCDARFRFSLLHGDLGAELLHGGDDLLGILLGDVLLHHLGRALDKLLGLDQAEAEQALNLLDDLGLGGGVKLLQLEGEEGLLGGGRGSLVGFFGGGGGSGGSSSEAADREIGDVELGLEKMMLLAHALDVGDVHP